MKKIIITFVAIFTLIIGLLSSCSIKNSKTTNTNKELIKDKLIKSAQEIPSSAEILKIINNGHKKSHSIGIGGEDGIADYVSEGVIVDGNAISYMKKPYDKKENLVKYLEESLSKRYISNIIDTLIEYNGRMGITETDSMYFEGPPYKAEKILLTTKMDNNKLKIICGNKRLGNESGVEHSPYSTVYVVKENDKWLFDGYAENDSDVDESVDFTKYNGNWKYDLKYEEGNMDSVSLRIDFVNSYKANIYISRSYLHDIDKKTGDYTSSDENFSNFQVVFDKYGVGQTSRSLEEGNSNSIFENKLLIIRLKDDNVYVREEGEGWFTGLIPRNYGENTEVKFTRNKGN